jgi:hypothetical protein
MLSQIKATEELRMAALSSTASETSTAKHHLAALTVVAMSSNWLEI